ncbi:hypothetical protein VTN96DRAFT_873 [Rasamsonia emersonii]
MENAIQSCWMNGMRMIAICRRYHAFHLRDANRAHTLSHRPRTDLDQVGEAGPVRQAHGPEARVELGYVRGGAAPLVALLETRPDGGRLQRPFAAHRRGVVVFDHYQTGAVLAQRAFVRRRTHCELHPGSGGAPRGDQVRPQLQDDFHLVVGHQQGRIEPHIPQAKRADRPARGGFLGGGFDGHGQESGAGVQDRVLDDMVSDPGLL